MKSTLLIAAGFSLAAGLFAVTDWNPLIAAVSVLLTALAVAIPAFASGYFSLRKMMLDNKRDAELRSAQDRREADLRDARVGEKIEEIHKATNGISERLNDAIRAEAELVGEKKERLRAQVEKAGISQGIEEHAKASNVEETAATKAKPVEVVLSTEHVQTGEKLATKQDLTDALKDEEDG